MPYAHQVLKLATDNLSECRSLQTDSGLRSCCLCSAKQLVVKYPAMCVAAWAYITAAVSMGITALLFVERSGWEVPRQLLGPLVTHPHTPQEPLWLSQAFLVFKRSQRMGSAPPAAGAPDNTPTYPARAFFGNSCFPAL